MGAGHTHTWTGKGDGTHDGGFEETSTQVNRRRHPYPQLRSYSLSYRVNMYKMHCRQLGRIALKSSG